MEITILNKLFRKIIAACVVLSMLICVNITDVNADEPVVTYGIEYSDKSATITFYTTIIDAFDIAVAYDPTIVSVADCGYTTQFKELQIGGKNTTISVLNDDAKDDAGNTYMVFTGAGANMDSGDAIDFAGKPLSYVTFEGNLAGAKLTIVTESATVSNIYEANTIGEVTLSDNSQTSITPEPIKDVVYESVDSTSDSSKNTDKNDSAKDSSTVQNENAENTDNSSSTEEQKPDETDSVSDKSESDAKETEKAEGENTKQDIADEDAETKDSKTKNSVIPVVLIVVAILIIAVLVIVIIRKKKK